MDNSTKRGGCMGSKARPKPKPRERSRTSLEELRRLAHEKADQAQEEVLVRLLSDFRRECKCGRWMPIRTTDRYGQSTLECKCGRKRPVERNKLVSSHTSSHVRGCRSPDEEETLKP